MTGADFWSRRKAAVEAEARAGHEAAQEAEHAATEAALAERSDAELLAEVGQPEPETLQSPEAVQEFLKSALPRRLKARALRRLWGLNPVLANLDGLVDYGEDFTDSATVVETLQTAYRIGRGMLGEDEETGEDRHARAVADGQGEETGDGQDDGRSDPDALPAAARKEAAGPGAGHPRDLQADTAQTAVRPAEPGPDASDRTGEEPHGVPAADEPPEGVAPPRNEMAASPAGSEGSVEGPKHLALSRRMRFNFQS